MLVPELRFVPDGSGLTKHHQELFENADYHDTPTDTSAGECWGNGQTEYKWLEVVHVVASTWQEHNLSPHQRPHQR